jgi:FkbM family methyltransferase
MSKLVENLKRYQEKRGGHHRAGTLSAPPLERIEWYLEKYFKGRGVKSVETGCGASTILFASYVEHHTAYTYDDRAEDNSSVSYAQQYPEFRGDRVQWVFGPTQRTIFSNPLEHDVDLILIDGPHGYPFPELEYFAFYKRLRPGGILIVDDVHIPTIRNFYKFLMQDDGFRPHGVVLTTAFFQRADTPLFNMDGDDWWLQRYNTQSFPAMGNGEIEPGSVLPISYRFEARLAEGHSMLTRGFSFYSGNPVTDGPSSTIEMKIAPQTPSKVRFLFEIEPVCVEERKSKNLAPGIRIFVNGQEVSTSMFSDSSRQTIEFEIEPSMNGGEKISVEFFHMGLLTGNELDSWDKSAWYDARTPNFWLRGVSVFDATASAPAAVNKVTQMDGSLVGFDYEGQRLSFFVDERLDSVSSFHVAGRFYEQSELEMIRAAIPPGLVILEIGAHVGNHTVYFSKYLKPKKVIAIEPNKRAQAVLRVNCALNNCDAVDLSKVDYALGAETGVGAVADVTRYSSGSTMIRKCAGDVKIVRGDDVVGMEPIDFIKIDIEGMEIEALEGLSSLIERRRPILFVEVKSCNDTAFMKFAAKYEYQIAGRSNMYPELTNYLIVNSPPRQRPFWRIRS